MRSLLTIGLGAALVATTATAQRLAVYDPTTTGGPGILEVIPPTAILPPGAPPVLVYPEAPVLPPPPAYTVPPGDSTFDGVNGFHYYTNGLNLAFTATPAFPPAVGLPPLNPSPFPPAVLGPLPTGIGGPVTGMAIVPGAIGLPGTLFLVSGAGTVIGVTSTPAGTIVVNVPAFAIGFPLAAQITGLEWDGITGQLLAVDWLGTVYPFFPGGAPAGPVIPAPAIPPGATGIAIDKTGMFNAWGTRSIYVLFGPFYVEATAPFSPPPNYPTGGSPLSLGIAYLPHPAEWPPGGGCPCPNFPMTQSITSAMSAGNAAFGFALGGMPPGQIALIAFDFGFNPVFPLINTIGQGFGFLFTSPTLNSIAIFADPFGNAVFNLPLLVPAGFGPLYYQAGTFCPADTTLGVVVTPMYQFSASGL